MDVISHSGRIVEITPDFIRVEIISESACSACHAKSMCSLSESKNKEVVVPLDFQTWSVGEEVNVNMKRSLGMKAVWLSYVMPLVVLFVVLMGLVSAGLDELYAGLVSLGAVGLYYVALLLFRDKLSNEYSFYITKK